MSLRVTDLALFGLGLGLSLRLGRAGGDLAPRRSAQDLLPADLSGSGCNDS
jgi:hypothetical protein